MGEVAIGHKADHSFPFGVEIENEWGNTSIYLYTWRTQGQIYFCCNSDYSSAVSKASGKCIPIGRSQFKNLTEDLLRRILILVAAFIYSRRMSSQ
jgi:hypothetical protein